MTTRGNASSLATLAATVAVLGCRTPPSSGVGNDARVGDAPAHVDSSRSDGAVDANVVDPVDAGSDGPVDAAIDAPVDAAIDAPVDAAIDAPPPAQDFGFIQVYLFRNAATVTSTVSTSFWRLVGTPQPNPCTEQVHGSCIVSTCNFVAMPNPYVQTSAGLVQLRVSGVTRASLQPNPDGTYPPFNEPTGWWTGGEVLTMTSAGAVAPASSQQIGAPTSLHLTEPVIPANGIVVAPRANNLRVSWTGTSLGVVQFAFAYPQTATRPFVQVACEFSPSAGTGVVPASAIAGVPSETGSFQAGTMMRAAQRFGTYSVTVLAHANGRRPSGEAYSGQIRFQ